MNHQLQKPLLNWYKENKRPFPWRENKNPYFIWVSEIMLQQTTTTAVVPFFTQFIKRFPTIKKLAQSKPEEVIEYWAGLGYYSRARNLHKTAQELSKLKQFPNSHRELLKLPGLGPYSARAISSIAFSEPVGVLDGNVIRVLSRVYDESVEWWKTKQRVHLQALSDSLVQGADSSEVNQALMELGATICLPKNPKCLLCPWAKKCKARKADTIEQLPLKKQKRKIEIWEWKATVVKHNNKVALVKNSSVPFLKNHWVVPGTAKLKKSRPKHWNFKHAITHHDIYVTVTKESLKILKNYHDVRWVDESSLKKWVPSTMVRKAIECV